MNVLLIFPGFILAFIIVLYYEHKIRLHKAEPKNKVHFYVARDNYGDVYLYMGKPRGELYYFVPCISGLFVKRESEFSKIGLNPADFKNIKWEDGPVEVFLNMED